MLRLVAKPGASLCRSTGGKKRSLQLCESTLLQPSTPASTLLRNATAIHDFHGNTQINQQQQKWKPEAARQPNLLSGDFCSELIPSSTVIPTRTITGPVHIGIRHFSTSKKDGSESSAKNESYVSPSEQQTSPTTPLAESTKSSSSGAADKKDPATIVGENAEARLREIVDAVRPTIKKVTPEIDPGDLLSVYGIVTLIAVILVAPTLIRYMRQSDNTYDDLDPNDPVQDLAKHFEEEFVGNDNGHDTTNSENKKGGLDSLAADLLNSPQMQQAVNKLIAQLLQSPEVKESAQLLLKELWNDLVADPETLAQIIHLLRHAIQEEQIKEAAIQLVTEVFSDKEVLDELVTLVQRLGLEKEVQSATQALLVESAHNALNDPEILDHSMEFATDVVGDDVVQQTAGEALYNTLSYAVRPTLSIVLSAFGAGLIVFSIAAFRNANSPSGGDGVEEALLRTLESTNMEKLWKILAMPLELLVSAKDAIVWLVTLPFRAVSSSFRGVGKAGAAATTMLGNFFQWILQLPSQLVQSILAGLGKTWSALTTRINDTSHATLAAISSSFLGVFFKNLAEAFSEATSKTQAAFVATGVLLNNGVAAADAWMQMAMEIVVQAHSRTLAALATASGKMTTGSEWLQKAASQTGQGISHGYDYLNELATALVIFLKDLFAGATGGSTAEQGPR